MEPQFKYVIQACFHYEYKLIYLNENSLDKFLKKCKCTQCHNDAEFEYFCCLFLKSFFQGSKAFNIICDKATVELTNQNNAPISKRRFSNVIDKYASCGCFYVKLNLQPTDNVEVVTPNVSFFYIQQVSCN